jgi:hypothetical protein
LIYINADWASLGLPAYASPKRIVKGRDPTSGTLMLTTPLEKLAYIITKAREFDLEVPPVDEDSGSNPSDDAEWDVLEASADNPTYQELVDAINGLSDLERIELLALTWLGRGDYAKEEWREALEEARRRFGTSCAGWAMSRGKLSPSSGIPARGGPRSLPNLLARSSAGTQM